MPNPSTLAENEENQNTPDFADEPWDSPSVDQFTHQFAQLRLAEALRTTDDLKAQAAVDLLERNRMKINYDLTIGGLRADLYSLQNSLMLMADRVRTAEFSRDINLRQNTEYNQRIRILDEIAVAARNFATAAAAEFTESPSPEDGMTANAADAEGELLRLLEENGF